jgi:hypothetical protein
MLYVIRLERVIHSFIHSFTGAYSPGRTLVYLSGFLDHTYTIRHTVGLLWKSDQPVAETSTYTGQQTYKHNKHPCPEQDSNPRRQQPSGRRPTL